MDISQRNLLELAMSSLPTGLFICDRDGIIRFINDAYANYLRVRPEDAMGRHITDFIPDSGIPAVIASGEPELGAWRSIQGSERKILVNRIPLRDQDGHVIVEPRYDYAAPFHNGFARVMRDGLWGFVDARGCEVIPPVYLYARDFDAVGAWVQTGSYPLTMPGSALPPFRMTAPCTPILLLPRCCSTARALRSKAMKSAAATM